MVLFQLDRLVEARRTAFEAVRRFPYNDVSFNTLAEILKAGNCLDDAEAVYREAVGRFPDDPVARTGLADLLRTLGDLDEAEELYRSALKLKSVHTPARRGLEQVDRLRRHRAPLSQVAEPTSSGTGRVTATPPSVGPEPAISSRDWPMSTNRVPRQRASWASWASKPGKSTKHSGSWNSR